MAGDDAKVAIAAIETDSNSSIPDTKSPSPAPGQLKRAATIAPQKWPSEPEELKETCGMRIALDLWDLFFCALPVGLMVKTTLCIIAHSRDGKLDHTTLDYVSSMTTGLLYVNEQV